ncbi:MAG: hypothetical protein Kow0025_02270 [Thermodesulfovibrionales bacterium]
MSVSTKKGDSGFTGTLRGERVPKCHLITEAVGAVDEANSFVGLARSSSGDGKVKRLLLQVQRHLFSVGAELSGGGPSKKPLGEADLRWVERLVEEFEEAMALPPGFVAFGQERGASELDVARTAIRRAERLAVRMKSEGLMDGPLVLKYLNRLSDLLFLLACYSEMTADERRRLGRGISSGLLSGPASGRWAVAAASLAAVLLAVVISLLLFHGAPDKEPVPGGHAEPMSLMHR